MILKLYSEEGFKHAQEKIHLYQKGGKDEKATSLKAYTYTLENGKVKKYKLSKDQIFKEEASDHYSIKKFTMPSLQKGAIVEWKYTITSPFFWHIDKQVLQYKIPVKKAFNNIKIPEYFVFKTHMKGYLSIPFLETQKSRDINYSYRTEIQPGIGGQGAKRYSDVLTFFENCYKINLTNVPAIKDEPFVSNLNNYKSSIDFELSYTDFPNSTREFYSTNWNAVCKDIYSSTKFGTELNKHNYLKKDLATLHLNDKTENQKLIAIFNFVKSKLNWDKTTSKYTKFGVKKAYKTGVGNSADINLILIAMLRESGLNAQPVLTSTKDYGIPLFPTLKGLNYVIASITTTDGNNILLDATEKYSAPNILPRRALNWSGKIISKNGDSETVSLIPKKHTTKTLRLNAKINKNLTANGMLKTSLSGLNALEYRNENNHLSEEKQILKLEKKYEIEINKYRVANKNNTLKPISCLLSFENSDDLVEKINNKIYINPLLFLSTTNNPFKSEERNFPIDFTMPWTNTYKSNITIPENFTIESIPEAIGIGLPDNIGFFKYTITQQGNNLLTQATLQFNEAIIIPKNYQYLKKFYSKMIAKQAEKIVLVKK